MHPALEQGKYDIALLDLLRIVRIFANLKCGVGLNADDLAIFKFQYGMTTISCPYIHS